MRRISLQEALEGIEDTRRIRSIMYPLNEILVIMLLAVICGATSYAKVELFGKSKQQWLKKFLRLEYGIPDACTIRDVIRQIDTEQLHKAFIEWMKAVVCDVFGVIAFDGKEARRTKSNNKRPLHVVSAFSHAAGLVLGQLACDEKSNEITAIPKLLEMLEIKGCIVTIDAMGTQKDIAKKIIEKGADYCLSLKGNQPELYEDIKLFAESELFTTDCKALREAGQYFKSVEKGHGRIEKREYYVCNDVSWLSCAEKWAGLSGFGVCVSTFERGGERSTSHNYVIYSVKNMTARQFANYKRAHWSIENQLHWVLDVVFGEDDSRARVDNSAENLNIFRHMAYNILKSEDSFRGSFSDKQFKCLLDEQYLEKIVVGWLCS
jgi:predicted transposase YbfD/YdcC